MTKPTTDFLEANTEIFLARAKALFIVICHLIEHIVSPDVISGVLSVISLTKHLVRQTTPNHKSILDYTMIHQCHTIAMEAVFRGRHEK